jgi:hypothetical protein
MEDKNQLQILLKEWAENAVRMYHQIASRDDVNIAYYTQSDLSLLTTSPELMIVGINPGSFSSYSDQRRNENWSYLYKNPLDENHLLKGNYCHEKGKPSSWDNHRKWKYWSGLRHCLSKTYLLDTIDNDNKIIITNASFFSTKKANEISEELLIETIPQTLNLIKNSNPKYLLFLSGKRCFERLNSISKLSGLINFEYRHVCGNIYIGNLNGKLCIGIPHPAYKTTEELNLIASVMSFVINQKNYKDIDVEVIKNECSEQIRAYEERIKNHKKTTCPIDFNSVVLFLKEKLNGEMADPKKCTVKLNETLEFSITSKGNGYVGIRHFSYKGQCKYSAYPYSNTQEYREILKKYQYDTSQDAWIGQKSFNSYTGENVEKIVNSIVEEVAKIKKEIEMI